MNKLQTSDGKFSIEAICFSGDLIASGQNGGAFFEIAKDEFILPLLEATELSPDCFYTCMGNHKNDLASFDDIIYQGLNSKFNSPDDLRKLWKADKIYNYLPVGVSSFKNFVEKTNAKVVSLSELTYIAKETFRDSNVAICAFNSAWNSCGETQKDYGRLVIGKEEIQKALVGIEGCDIKIAILHHPIEYLMEYDRIESEKLLQQFDLFLTGHTHSQNEFQRYSSVTNTLFLSAGRLDSYKTELTGYSIIEINPYNKEVKTFFRKYYDKRKCFDKAVDMSEDGEFEELLKDFFEPFGLDFKASGFETIFFSKKVLNNSDDSISFSYQFILEYYIAKSFIKFGFPDDLVNDYKFLDFSNELNYYSGMTRQKNSLFNLIERLLIEQLDNYKEMIPDYKNYKIDINISYIYPKSKLSLEEKNTITDISDNSNSYSPESYTKQSKHAPSPESLFPQLFYLYGRLVRNIDYLELQEKVNAVTYSMDACCLLLALFNKGLECVLKEKGDEIKASFLKNDASVNVDSLLKEIVNAIKLSIPIALECSLYDCIGNTKLSPIFREVSQSNQFTDLEQCFFLMLYLDLHDGKSYEAVKKFIKTGTEKNLLNIIYSKLIYSYMLTNSVYEERRLEDLIWTIVKKQNPTQLIRGQTVGIDKEKSFKALTDKKESLKASSETM